MKLKYAIAALGIAIGLLSLLRAPDRSVDWFVDNDAARAEVVARCADRSMRGQDCDSARLAGVLKEGRSVGR